MKDQIKPFKYGDIIEDISGHKYLVTQDIQVQNGVQFFFCERCDGGGGFEFELQDNGSWFEADEEITTTFKVVLDSGPTHQRYAIIYTTERRGPGEQKRCLVAVVDTAHPLFTVSDVIVASPKAVKYVDVFDDVEYFLNGVID